MTNMCKLNKNNTSVQHILNKHKSYICIYINISIKRHFLSVCFSLNKSLCNKSWNGHISSVCVCVCPYTCFFLSELAILTNDNGQKRQLKRNKYMWTLILSVWTQFLYITSVTWLDWGKMKTPTEITFWVKGRSILYECETYRKYQWTWNIDVI